MANKVKLRSNIASLIVHAYETNDENLKYSLKFLDFFETVEKKFPEYKTSYDDRVHIPEIDEPLFLNISHTVPFDYVKDFFDLDWVIQSNNSFDSASSISAKLFETNQLETLNSFLDLVVERINEEKKSGKWDNDSFSYVSKFFFQPILSYEANIRHSEYIGMSREDIADYEKIFMKTMDFYLNEKEEVAQKMWGSLSRINVNKDKKWFKNYNNVFSSFSSSNRKEDFASILILNPKSFNMLHNLIEKEDFDLSFMKKSDLDKLLGTLTLNKDFSKIKFLINKNIIKKEDLTQSLENLSYNFINTLNAFFKSKNNKHTSIENICKDFKDRMDFFTSIDMKFISDDMKYFFNVMSAKSKDELDPQILLNNRIHIYEDKLSNKSFNLAQCFFIKDMFTHFDAEFFDRMVEPNTETQYGKFRDLSEFFVLKLSLLAETPTLDTTFDEKIAVGKWFEEVAVNLYDNISSSQLDDKILSFIKIRQMDDDLEKKSITAKKIKI